MHLDGDGAAGREVRLAIPALGFTLSGRTGPDGSWTGEAPAPRGLKLLVAGQPEALRRPLRGGRGRADRPRRLPHDRGSRRRHPAQRQADLPARHQRACRGIGRRPDPGDDAGGGARSAARGQGRAARQLRPPRPLSAPGDDDPRGRRTRPARLERDPGLLAGRFRQSAGRSRPPGTCSPRRSCATATAPRSSSGASATKRRSATPATPSSPRLPTTSARSIRAASSAPPC